ncbi:MAG: VWA domain-containing protein [Planctomycetes bacterium]|nr:VWA domain-containing protein [Planctomycetota bacterium]
MRVAYIAFDENEARRRFNRKELMKLWAYLLLKTSGDVPEALEMLHEMLLRHGFDADAMMAEFEQMLRDQKLIRTDEATGVDVPTKKAERFIRQDSLDQVFRDLRSLGAGDHRTPKAGHSNERLSETRPFSPGDLSSDIDFNLSIRNALKRGIDEFSLDEDDLEVFESEQHASCATVLMIDLSHSMTLYGEDRITPAKRVAIALAELIQTKYPKDDIEVVTFGDDAERVGLSRLPYLSNGPFHTNTRAGLQLAQRLLGRKKHTNKQIFMITDGKPSAIFEQGRLYKNPFGLDPLIVNRTLEEADHCRRRGIVISTFMIAHDPVLVDFIDKLTRINQGRAYYSALDSLGGNILVDYIRNRRKRVR